MAREWIALIKGGRDPREVERERIAAESRARAAETAKADATIRKAWERYSKFIDHQRQADKVRQVFNADILPFLGDTAVHELTRQQVKDRIRAIAKRSVHQAFATFFESADLPQLVPRRRRLWP